MFRTFFLPSVISQLVIIDYILCTRHMATLSLVLQRILQRNVTFLLRTRILILSYNLLILVLFFFLKDLLLFYVYEWFARIYVYVLHVSLVSSEAGKRWQSSLNLELQMIVGCHLWVLRIKHRLSGRTTSAPSSLEFHCCEEKS